MLDESLSVCPAVEMGTNNASRITAAFPSARDVPQSPGVRRSSEHKPRLNPHQPCPEQPAGLASSSGGILGEAWWWLFPASTREGAPGSFRGASRTPPDPSGKGPGTGTGERNAHLSFLFIYLSGLAVAGISSACLRDKAAHGATCPGREGSSPPWTPPPVFFRAGKGTLYVQFVGSTPLCNCPCHPGLPNDFVLTCARGI